MTQKPARTILEQLELLQNRGMLFRDLDQAKLVLRNISYYRLKGYWWDMQVDQENHIFEPNTFFEDVLERYEFDRKLKMILFNAIERVEIALRTKMIYILSLSNGANWYSNSDLFHDIIRHSDNLESLEREYGYSQEIFIKDHKRRHPNTPPEAWKIMEVASLGTLSKFYKNLNHQLPEKSRIANDLGLNLHRELSSWLEAITYIRNIIAHHSRLWSRNMVKVPAERLVNPRVDWFNQSLTTSQRKKPFLIISTLVYLNKFVAGNDSTKNEIIDLFNNFPSIPLYKIGFTNSWNDQPIWN